MSIQECCRVLNPDKRLQPQKKDPLDLFPVHFKANQSNRWIRLTLNILCYVYALNIIYVVATMMNGPELDLTGLPTYHLPVLEHTWGFLVRSIINRIMMSVLILMIIIMFISIFSYSDVLTAKYKERLKEVSIIDKAVLLIEHYIETCFINGLILLRFILLAVFIGILIGWSMQIFAIN